MRDLFSIAGKTALVTGGSRGIGLMIARGFVEAGAKVYISSRKADVCDRAATELAQAGTCVSVPADVSTEAGARGLADAVAAREHVPVLETYAYSASKAAVHHLTRVLARRLAPHGVTVNAVAPGPFESKMMAETLQRFRDAIVASCPLGRIGEPEDMAGVAIYLASRAGAYLTGAVIPVDGGISTCV